ncbi:MAG TPA: hypothetical protein VG672_18950 [Bryobacteraceae bacterium]|jgi:hypothetical protein|nr:hypothetical protein [Bryobacteraceae bacterium]
MKQFARRIQRCVLPAAAVLLAGAGLAQNAGQERPSSPPPSQQRSDSPKSVTGCLTKAGGANQYAVADSKSGEKVTFTGPETLDKYVKQTVKINGRIVTTQNGEKAFQPESLQQVAATCEGTQ